MTTTRNRSSATWAAITTALFFPHISNTLLAVCVVCVFVVGLLQRGEQVPILTIVAIAVAGGSLFLESSPAYLWFFNSWLMSAQTWVGIPVEIEPSLFVSRGLIAYALCGFVARDFKSVWLGIWINLALSGFALVAFGVVAPAFPISYRNAAIAIITLWGVSLAVNWLIAERILRSSQLTQRGLLVLLIGGCAVAVAILAASTQSLLGRDTQHGSESAPMVAVFEPKTFHGGREFGTSSQGFGLPNIGLYGDMSEFLVRLGYHVKEIDTLTELSDINPSCLYCPSFSRLFSDAEVTALREFLESGGSLIAVAEHTNLEGSTDILNPLLSRYGLKVRFDNTNGLWGEGLTGSQVGKGQMSCALRNTPYLTHNRGASIQLERLNATPLLIGRFWQGDQGDSLCPDRAYLSDGRLSAGDRLGNVVLMAEARAGKGRVFVSGDSSPFLNQNLSYNTHFLVTLFSFMTMPDDADRSSWISRLIGVLVAVTLVILFRKIPRHKNQDRIALVALCILIAGAAFSNSRPQAKSSRTPDADWAVVSTAENNVFDRDPFSESATTGLALQIFRSGLLPTLGDWEAFEQSPRAIFIINPTIRLGESEIRQLSDRIESGTRVIIAGDGENDAFIDLAQGFGFDVSDEPVGSASDGRMTTFTAWRVRSVPDDAIPLAIGGTTVGGTMSLGTGKITVIADGGFLLSRNLESETAYDEGNSAFVRELLESVDDEK